MWEIQLWGRESRPEVLLIRMLRRRLRIRDIVLSVVGVYVPGLAASQGLFRGACWGLPPTKQIPAVAGLTGEDDFTFQMFRGQVQSMDSTCRMAVTHRVPEPNIFFCFTFLFPQQQYT